MGKKREGSSFDISIYWRPGKIYLVDDGVGPRLGVAACRNSSRYRASTPICLIITYLYMIRTRLLHSNG